MSERELPAQQESRWGLRSQLRFAMNAMQTKNVPVFRIEMFISISKF